jgi:hypothetical protein
VCKQNPGGYSILAQQQLEKEFDKIRQQQAAIMAEAFRRTGDAERFFPRVPDTKIPNKKRKR